MAEEGGSSHLEQFCLLAKTAKGRACVALIQQVLNNPKIFVVGELLMMDNVQALRGTEHENQLKLLDIFAFGTLKDYQKNSEQLPELTDLQKTKLRQLSIISFAQKNKVAPYSALQDEVEIHNIRELEDLIIECIYSGLVKGKLNQQEGVFKVTSCISRDVRHEIVDDMLLKLKTWQNLTEQMILSLKDCVLYANNKAKAEESRISAVLEKVEASRKEAHSGANMGIDDSEAFDEMDIDRPKKQGSRGKRVYAAAIFDHHMSRGGK